MQTFQVTIIGAGVVGLSIARELSKKYKDVLLVEKNDFFGQEISSRNSEVIHAGIYYPQGLKKTVLCREGNALLYDYCEDNGIPHKRTGKLIVAVNGEETDELDAIKGRAELNGVDDLYYLPEDQIRRMEPEVKAFSALYSPSTGIIDSHSLMRCLLRQAEDNGSLVVFRSEITAVKYDGKEYELSVNNGDHYIKTRILVNSAGLYSDRVAAMAGIDIDKSGYRLKYCKGDYFSASPSPKLTHLVYPVPVKNNEGLGVHATIDLSGRVKFGPDVEYVDCLNYEVSPSRRDAFYNAIVKYLPGLKIENLHPDMSGIRPKLQGPGEPYRDFVIEEESEKGFTGLINLVGIESPGLTSCLAIARQVLSLVQS